MTARVDPMNADHCEQAEECFRSPRKDPTEPDQDKAQQNKRYERGRRPQCRGAWSLLPE